MKISYAITTHNEFAEFDKLMQTLTHLLSRVPYQYEIVVLDDNSTHPEMINVLNKWKSSIKLEYSPFTGNFSDHKNKLISLCSGDVIFNIDADELPSEKLVMMAESVFLSNQEIEVFSVPRINIVNGITLQHITQSGWKISSSPALAVTEKVDTEGMFYTLLQHYDLVQRQESLGNRFVEMRYMRPIINFPDYQKRLWRNLPTIRWQNKVHETLLGFKTIGAIPTAIEYSLYHEKDIKKQEQQNQLYAQLGR